jgi:hypothetical protein
VSLKKQQMLLVGRSVPTAAMKRQGINKTIPIGRSVGNFQKLRITSSSIDSGMENAFIYCDA